MANDLFAVVPIEVIQDKRLTLEQTRVLVALFSFRNKVTNTVWPSRSAIAERTGMHPSNISAATTRLAALGWLTKQGLGGLSKSTRYTLVVPDIAPIVAAHSATVANSATTPLADSATPPVADSATRTEQSSEQSIEQSNSEAPTALPVVIEIQADPVKQKKSRKPAKGAAQDETALQAACRATWAAYSDAYCARYGVEPTRNASVSSKVKQFVIRIGHDESPGVARFYVDRVSEAFVLRGCHALGTLLHNAEAYRTQWATGQTMTNTRAQQADKTQSNFDAAQGAKVLLRARREQRNAQ